MNNYPDTPEGVFYFNTVKTVVEKKPVSFRLFKEKLQHFKPKHIWHEHYSDTTPCYFITRYDDENDVLYVFANNSDKVPKRYTYKKLFNEFSFQDITLFSFNERQRNKRRQT